MKPRCPIRQSDLEIIFRAAKVAGSTVQINPSTFEITVIPFSPSEGQDFSAANSTPKHLTARVPGSRGDVDDNTLEKLTGKGGYPIPSKSSDALQDWYDQLGFDPTTMGEVEMQQLIEKADAQWRKELPKTPMNKLEKSALVQLRRHGVGVRVDWRDVKSNQRSLWQSLL